MIKRDSVKVHVVGRTPWTGTLDLFPAVTLRENSVKECTITHLGLESSQANGTKCFRSVDHVSLAVLDLLVARNHPCALGVVE